MRLTQKKRVRGFTLIEVLIVVAIIGILAAVAIPQYRDYRVDAQISHALAALEAQSVDLQAAYEDTGSFPATSALAAIPGSDGMQMLWWTKPDGQAVHIEAWLGADIYPGAVAATMIVNEGIADAFGNISWGCKYHNLAARKVKAEYMPAQCDSKVDDEF